MMSAKLLFAGATLLGTGLGIFSLPTSTSHVDITTNDEIRSLEVAEYLSHSQSIFNRADFSGDQHLDADEYATLMVVQAQLFQLNGFIRIDAEDRSGRIKANNIGFNDEPYRGLGKAERIRVDAVARLEFHAVAGEDGKLSASEFRDIAEEKFNKADRNNNGLLKNIELQNLVLDEASVIRSAV